MTQAAAGSQIRRPTYQEGRLLEAAELQAEQRSRTDALTRHERNIHTPGVITGLQVTAAAGNVQIQPGLAVDGSGRYLGLDRLLTTSLSDGEDVTVSIVWRQGAAQIELSDRPPPAPADRTPDAWPVVLGQAARSAGKATVRADAREELQLRATTLSTPAGGSRVLLGGHGGRSTQVLGVQLASDAGFADATTVDADGTARVCVDSSVADAVYAAQPVVLDTPVSPPPAAVPWSLYRATVTRPDQTVVEQLRLEVGEVKSGVDPHSLELLVMQGGTGAEQDLLHVDAGTTVTIPNNLTVEGFTTVTGTTSPLPGGATLSSLAAQEADLLAMAQVILNRLTNTDLQATQVGTPTIAGSQVTYTLRLTTSATTAVSGVAVYQTVIGPAQLISHQFIAQGLNLPAASTHDITQTTDAGATGLTVTIAVLAIGVGQDGQPRTATLQLQAST